MVEPLMLGHAVDLVCNVLISTRCYCNVLLLNKVEDDNNEFEVWHGLANLYFSLSHWRDTEICLEKAMQLKPFSAIALTTKGAMQEARGQIQDALATYTNAALMDFSHSDCKVSIGALFWKIGLKSSSVARGFLSDALRIDPTNRLFWYYLGMVHKDNGQDCGRGRMLSSRFNARRHGTH